MWVTFHFLPFFPISRKEKSASNWQAYVAKSAFPTLEDNEFTSFGLADCPFFKPTASCQDKVVQHLICWEKKVKNLIHNKKLALSDDFRPFHQQVSEYLR